MFILDDDVGAASKLKGHHLKHIMMVGKPAFWSSGTLEGDVGMFKVSCT
jgi:hypothetical protein